MKQRMAHVKKAPAAATGALAVGSVASGALVAAALALGAVAIGALAVGRLSVGRARIRRLQIDELVVRRIRLAEPLAGSPRPDPDTEPGFVAACALAHRAAAAVIPGASPPHRMAEDRSTYDSPSPAPSTSATTRA